MKLTPPALALTALALAAVVAGCASPDRSRNLADPAAPPLALAQQVCSACHGIDGNPVSPQFPRLAGQQASYLVSQLTNFRSHGRSDPDGYIYMWGLSRQLTDAQIAGLADYFSKQVPRRPRVGAVDAAVLAEGKRIYEEGVPEQAVIACASCHGPRGEGIAAFPRLAFQHADYLVKQLDVFQNTQQRPGTPMEFVAHPLTGDNKHAVALYMQQFPE
jgi:cytochrome c553